MVMALTEEENRVLLARLEARPWRATCSLCIGTLWCTDTEAEAERLVTEHVDTRHVLWQVWQVHPEPEYDPDDAEAQRIAEVFVDARAEQDRGL